MFVRLVTSYVDCLLRRGRFWMGGFWWVIVVWRILVVRSGRRVLDGWVLVRIWVVRFVWTCTADYGGGIIWRILTAVFWDFSIEHSPIGISYDQSCTAFFSPTLLTLLAHLPSPSPPPSAVHSDTSNFSHFSRIPNPGKNNNSTTSSCSNCWHVSVLVRKEP